MAPIKILASQAHSINLHKNLRTKVMKCCANIYSNRQCLNNKVIPKYANILGSQKCALLLDVPYT